MCTVISSGLGTNCSLARYLLARLPCCALTASLPSLLPPPPKMHAHTSLCLRLPQLGRLSPYCMAPCARRCRQSWDQPIPFRLPNSATSSFLLLDTSTRRWQDGGAQPIRCRAHPAGPIPRGEGNSNDQPRQGGRNGPGRFPRWGSKPGRVSERREKRRTKGGWPGGEAKGTILNTTLLLLGWSRCTGTHLTERQPHLVVHANQKEKQPAHTGDQPPPSCQLSVHTVWRVALGAQLH